MDIREIHGYALSSPIEPPQDRQFHGGTRTLHKRDVVLVVVETADSGLGVTEFDAMGIAAATFLNIGPAFGVAGPYGSYAGLSPATKWVLVVLMWVGRIEIVPVLVVLTPAFWRS